MNVLLLKASLECAGKNKILHQVVLHQMQRLLPAKCMFNRQHSMQDPITGLAVAIEWKKLNRPFGGFTLLICDDENPLQPPQSQSKIVLTWLKRYAEKRNMKKRLEASGWQEVLIEIKKNNWIPLSTLLPSYIRQLQTDKMLSWLTTRCPVDRLTLESSHDICTFIRESLNTLNKREVKEVYERLQGKVRNQNEWQQETEEVMDESYVPCPPLNESMTDFLVDLDGVDLSWCHQESSNVLAL